MIEKHYLCYKYIIVIEEEIKYAIGEWDFMRLL